MHVWTYYCSCEKPLPRLAHEVQSFCNSRDPWLMSIGCPSRHTQPADCIGREGWERETWAWASPSLHIFKLSSSGDSPALQLAENPEKAAVLCEVAEPGLLFNILIQDSESQNALTLEMNVTESVVYLRSVRSFSWALTESSYSKYNTPPYICQLHLLECRVKRERTETVT